MCLIQQTIQINMRQLLAPSLRVGWVSGPHAIVSRVVYFHMTCTMGGSILSQVGFYS